jgi:hypothetical protein
MGAALHILRRRESKTPSVFAELVLMGAAQAFEMTRLGY